MKLLIKVGDLIVERLRFVFVKSLCQMLQASQAGKLLLETIFHLIFCRK